MPSNRPIGQHYVPRLLLREFTDTRNSETGRLWAFDLQRQRKRYDSVANCAVENNFYTANLGPGLDPYGFEKALAALEGEWATTVSNIIASNSLPPRDSEAMGGFTMFMAMQMMRTPFAKTMFAERRDLKWLSRLEAMRQQDARWDDYLKALAARAPDYSILESDGRIREPFGEPQSDTWQKQQMFLGAMFLPYFIIHRELSLWVLPEEAEPFVCSDKAVSAFTLDDPMASSWEHFWTFRSIITCPIGKRHAIVGAVAIELPQDEDSAISAALLNTATISGASWAFGPNDDFVIYSSDGEITRTGGEFQKSSTPSV